MKTQRIEQVITAIITLLAICTLTSLTLLIAGCGEGMEMAKDVVGPATEPTDPKSEQPAIVGDMKKPEESPDKPTEPETPAEESAEPTVDKEPEEPEPATDTTPPTVVEVGWYSDWQMTQPLTADSIVHPEDTVYTVVVFSEAMQHTVGDSDIALPALSIVADSEETRYRMLPHGVGFESGEAKPLKGGINDYLCKYTVPADIVGTITLRVETDTVDTTGNAITEELIYPAAFVVAKIPEKVPTTLPEPIPASTDSTELTSDPIDEPQRRAEEMVDHIMSLQGEANYSAAERNRILEEESGLAYQFITGTLLDIYFEERPEEKGDPFSWYDIVLEYLRLSFAYPDVNEEGLLEHFRQSIKDGRVTIDIDESAYIKKRGNRYERQRVVIAEIRPMFERITEREVEILQQYHMEDIPLNIPAELNTIFMEEAGISFDFAHNTLLAIHLEENPEDKDVVVSGIYRYSRLISHYLFFRKTFDSEKKGSILDRFRKSAREGNTYIKLGAPLAAW